MDVWENEGGAVANPPKKKGTGGENEVVAILVSAGLAARRTSPGMNYDVYVPGSNEDDPFEVLATRPDRGRWLATLPMDDLAELVRFYNSVDLAGSHPVHIEVKRYRRFSLHTIFENPP